MDIKWTREARNSFKKIYSTHFSHTETIEYKKRLAIEIRNKILTMMETMPTNEQEWQGNYRIFVDSYKVYYSFSDDKRTCYIKGFKHQKQK